MPMTILRGLCRDKLYALINIAGLSLAMASCLALGLYLRSELTYDRHHLQHERIYRVATEFTTNGRTDQVARSARLLGPMLAEDFAEVQAFVRFSPLNANWETGTDRLIRHGNDAFYWRDVYVADDNVFDVFTHEIVYGDPESALLDPSSAAVSRSFAEKYFGSANPLSEIITLDNGEQRTITLVFEDLPENTHLRYDVLFSYNGVVTSQDQVQRARELFSATDHTYLVMPEGYDARDFGALADAFFTRYMAERGREIHVDRWSAWLQPLADIHLHSDVGLDLPTGNRYYLLGLEAAVAFILLVACINHVNLATASAVRRAKEIGTRKILGATRASLAFRFISESMLLSVAALPVSVLLVKVVVPLTPIPGLLGGPVALSLALEPDVIAAATAFSLALGALSGLYPALRLSATRPLTAMSSRGEKLGGSGLPLRELLVLVQFTVTACVITCTLLMASQMRYVGDRPLGFAEQGRLVVTLRGTDVLGQIPVIERELENDERILGVTSSDALLGLDFPAGFMDVETNDGTMSGVLVHHLPAAEDFIDVLGMQVVTGRSFSRDVATDQSEAMIVNEALVRLMGWSEPLGKRMGLRGRTVVGVVRDFNFKSLHTPVEPLVMYLSPRGYEYIPAELRPFKQKFLVLNVATSDLSDTLDLVRRTIRRFDPVHPLEYRFVDDSLEQLYVSEQRMMRLIGLFSGICIFVACLGLFGLATFTTARRTKEIGIRKVLGASMPQIVALLSRRTVQLVAFGCLLASALSYAAMRRWLAAFAYRVDINAVPFLAAAAIVLAVALSTVALQALKSARTRPVQSLRSE